VIDDFLLILTKEQEQKYLIEIFELFSLEKSLLLYSKVASAECHRNLRVDEVTQVILNRAYPKPHQLFLSDELLRNV